MRQDVQNEIIKRGGDNLNKSEIARILQCSRQTIYNREQRLKEGVSRKPRSYDSKLDDYKVIIEDKTDKLCSAFSIFKFIQKQGFKGAYGIVSKYVREYKGEQQKKATIRFETNPGLQAQVDWKESMKLHNKRGEEIVVNFFLMILGYSRYKFIKLTTDRNQKTLFECMVAAFSYFCGCPEEILFDNMRTVVDNARTSTTTVVFNAKFMSFANDTGFTPLACVGYRPQTKGKVESVARLMNRLKVYDYEFETWSELETIVNEFCEEINSEIVQGVGIIPKVVHEKEKEYLNTIPLWDKLLNYYDPEKIYKVSKESLVNYKGKKYSVPPYLIGKQVSIVEMTNEIRIYYNTTDLVVTHPKSDSYINYSTENYKDIIKSEVYRHKNDDELNEIIELKRKDKLLGINIHD